MQPNRVVLITGASSGIGRLTAQELASRGSVKLALVARNQDRLADLKEELEKGEDVTVLTFPLDLRQGQAIPGMVETVIERLGRLDVVIHAAGATEFKAALEWSREEVEQEFELNTLSGIYLAQAAAGYMLKVGRGKIILIASMAGKLPTPQASLYAASKAALQAFAAAFRMELAPTVELTVVNPGPIKTAFFQHSASMMDYIQKVDRFAMEPEQVVEKLLHLVNQKRPLPAEVNLPFVMRLAWWGQRFFPRLATWLSQHFANFK